MDRIRRIIMAAALTGSLSPMPAGAAPQGESTVFGLWREPDRQAVVKVYPCDGKLCGDLVRLPAGAVAVDENNPDPALRGRSLIGLTVIEGFSAVDDTERAWIGGGRQGRLPGRIYVPANGDTLGDAHNTYLIRLRDRDTLTIGIGNCFLTCLATSTWQRVRPDAARDLPR